MNQESAEAISKAFEEHVKKQEGNAQPDASVEATTEETPVEETEQSTKTDETTAEAPTEVDGEETPKEEVNAVEDRKENTEEPTTPTFTFGEESEVEAAQEDYKSVIEALKEENEKLKNSSSDVFASEELRVANEFVKNGGNIQDFFRAQTINTEVDFGNDQSMLDLLKSKYITLDGFTEKEADRLINKKFEALVDKDTADEDDIIDARIELKSAAKEAQPKLEDFKSKATFSKPDPELIKQQQAQLDKWKSETNVRLSQIKNFKFDLADDFPINVNLDKESYNYISSLLLQPENLQSYWVDRYEKDGVTDVEGFSRDRFIELHAEKLIKTAYAQGVSAGEKKFAQRELRQENPDSTKKRSTSASESKAWKGELLNVAQQVFRT